MLPQLARFANDCYYILRAPTASKPALLRDLVLPAGKKMGFRVTHFDRRTLNELYREIFARQPYYFRAESAAPVIFDCGANVGMASLYFKWLYPESRVRAFEPDPATFLMLRENVARNNLDIEVHNCALWDQETEVDFFVDSKNPGGLLMSTDSSRAKGAPIKVSARKLSDFIDGTVDFLKLDVEGAEHRVLCDLFQTGKLEAIQQIVIEYHHKIGEQKSKLAPFLSILERAGFEYQIHAGLYPVISRGAYQDILIAAYRERRT
jgi:FkbM family methyltransferase